MSTVKITKRRWEERRKRRGRRERRKKKKSLRQGLKERSLYTAGKNVSNSMQSRNQSGESLKPENHPVIQQSHYQACIGKR